MGAFRAFGGGLRRVSAAYAWPSLGWGFWGWARVWGWVGALGRLGRRWVCVGAPCGVLPYPAMRPILALQKYGWILGVGPCLEVGARHTTAVNESSPRTRYNFRLSCTMPTSRLPSCTRALSIGRQLSSRLFLSSPRVAPGFFHKFPRPNGSC